MTQRGEGAYRMPGPSLLHCGINRAKNSSGVVRDRRTRRIEIPRAYVIFLVFNHAVTIQWRPIPRIFDG